MEIYADSVRVDGPHGPLLRETSVRVADGEVVLVAGEPGAGHTALALVLSGRLEPSSGDVLLNNTLNPVGLRNLVAPVDVPGVSAPEPGLVLAHAVAEELAMAHEPARRSAVKRWLEVRDAQTYLDREIGMLPASMRIRILTDLAAARRDVRALVLACPDRHGGRPEFWWRIARGYAAEGFAVVVLCNESSARELGVEPQHLGERELNGSAVPATDNADVADHTEVGPRPGSGPLDADDADGGDDTEHADHPSQPVAETKDAEIVGVAQGTDAPTPEATPGESAAQSSSTRPALPPRARRGGRRRGLGPHSQTPTELPAATVGSRLSSRATTIAPGGA